VVSVIVVAAFWATVTVSLTVFDCAVPHVLE
jgi:hypothetical protein